MSQSDPNNMAGAMKAAAGRLHELLGLDRANPGWQDLEYMSPLDNLFRFIGGEVDPMRDDPAIVAVGARRFCERLRGVTPQTSQAELAKLLHEFAGIVLILTDPILREREAAASVEDMIVRGAKPRRPLIGSRAHNAVARLAEKDGD